MAGTGLLHWLAAARTPLLTDIAVSITALGSVTFAAVLCYTFYHFRRRDEAVLTLVAAATGGTAATVLKAVVARPRPTVVDPVITGYMQNGAFPSGHAAIAFALATVLEEELDRANYYLFLLAGLVALSRVYLGLHYVGDVVAGAALGVVAGLLVHRYRALLLSAADRHL